MSSSYISLTLLLYLAQCFSSVTSSNSVKFFIWTRNNAIHPEVHQAYQFKSNVFNPNLPTKFLVHGYKDVGDTDWIIKVKDEYLTKEDCNVISLDWRMIAAENYFSAVWQLKDVARSGKVFLIQINNPRFPQRLSPEKLHPVGFSLGAHVVGILGKLMNQSIPRITGLDPARPILELLPSSWKLDRKSAQNVDVIHGAGHYLTMMSRVGTIDFYPNGGVAPQPGCQKESLDLVCSHLRAAYLFAESINSPIGFKSRLCNSWRDFQMGQCKKHPINWMGEIVNSQTRGVFYLITRSQSPFAIP